MVDELVVVFAGKPVRAGMIRSLLEAEGLTAFLRDENMGTIDPWAVSGAAVAPVKVVVPLAEAERAREILASVGA